MTSNRPTQPRTTFEFVNEGEAVSAAPEPQRGQSVPADMKKTTLDSVSENLMEQIVDERNMERAWRKSKPTVGRLTPMA